jgi:hypothetical protein
MTTYSVSLDPNAALFTAPDSEKARIQNLVLNMIGGLEYKHLSDADKALRAKHEYSPIENQDKE